MTNIEEIKIGDIVKQVDYYEDGSSDGLFDKIVCRVGEVIKVETGKGFLSGTPGVKIVDDNGKTHWLIRPIKIYSRINSKPKVIPLSIAKHILESTEKELKSVGGIDWVLEILHKNKKRLEDESV